MKKSLLFLIFSFLSFSSNAENCDTTNLIFKNIKLGRINFQKDLKDIKKECVLNILDSVTKTNCERIILIIAQYYTFVEPNVDSDPFVDKIDSAILSKISYGLLNEDLEMSEIYYRYFDITGQLQWILEHDSLSRLAFQQYVMNRNGAVKDRITFLSCLIGDTTSFWIIYKNIKEERRKDVSALSFLLHNGMKYFGYYDLFLENAELLASLGRAPMVATVLYETLPKKYSFDAAKKMYSKIVLNEQIMRSKSSAEGENVIISVFNYDFYWGIPIFYPELTTSKEYINGCVNSEKFCEFDKRLYDLLVKTIKEKYKDLD